MSEKSTEKPVTTEVQTKKSVQNSGEKQEQKYKIEKLRANCMQLFSIATSTFDGAMYGCEREELTVNEAKAMIHKWLGRKG